MDIPRPEYPRPDFVREDWINLNGTWEFEFDDENKGLSGKWFDSHSFTHKINVPFTFESRLSGIGDTTPHEVVWYKRKFRVPEAYRGRRILLNFGAVDFRAAVWLNGELIAEHTGGYTPFRCDITESLKPENVLVVRVEDKLNKDQPRGKQSWGARAAGTQYSRATGIWQSVWLEPVSPFHISYVRFYPNVQESTVRVAVGISGCSDKSQIRTRFSIDGKRQAELKLPAKSGEMSFDLWLKNPKLWTPENPDLYNVMIELRDGNTVHDRVLSYFGMRSISVHGGKLMLNNEPYYLRFVLDQGYYPGGLYTAPDDESYKRDIRLAKQLGFNGLRKHQKIEDPRFYYWCDKLGLLVWSELPNAADFTDASMSYFAGELPQVLQARFNHPSIITWVLFSEKPAIPGLDTEERPQEYAGQLVAHTRRLDPTRPVIDNSGFSHVDTDIVDLHEYCQDAAYLYRTLCQLSTTSPSLPPSTTRVSPMADGFAYRGQPIVISEYGGIALESDTVGGAWGYGENARNTVELLDRFRSLTETIARTEAISGYCYTQLYDVEKEVNGLLTFDRKPKVDFEAVATINKS